jgi:hypothetical protein
MRVPVHVPTHISVQCRVFVARHRWISWLVIFSLAGAVGLAVHTELRKIDAARAAWGETVSVLVTDDDHAAGDLASVERRDLPAALVPASALRSLAVGATLRQRVAAGEILTSTDITAIAGPAAGATTDSVVVGVIDPLARGAVVGSSVRIASEGIVLAESGEVVSLADEIIFVAVDSADAPMIAAAAQAGLASILFVP